MGDDYENNAHTLCGKESLSKLLKNGNKMLAEFGNNTVIAFLHNISSNRIVQRLQTEMLETKSK